LSDLPEDIQRHIRFVENEPLDKTARQYFQTTNAFLKKTLPDLSVDPKFAHDFETVAWYHTLLPAKLHRALCGFHESLMDGDFALNDAVAQLQICKKAVTLSIEAWRRIVEHRADLKVPVTSLLALLQNMLSRIRFLEDSI
jgi:hypothetical protein